MSRPAVVLLIVAIAALSSGCGGSSTAPTEDSTAATTALDGDTGAVEVPVDAAPAGEVPVIEEATYASGSAHVEVSGGKSATFDADLLGGGLSITAAGTTLLMYPSTSGDGQLFSIASAPDVGLAFTLTAEGIVTAGDRDNGCVIELSKNDSTGLAGQFDCHDLQTVGGDFSKVNVRATFSAAR